MRHLLAPSEANSGKATPTRRDRMRHQVHARLVALADLWEHMRYPWNEPALLVVLLLWGWSMPGNAPAPGQPAEAFWWYIVVLVVALVVSVAMAPKTPVPKPASLADFDTPQAEEGRAIPKIFGEYLVKDPNSLWFGNLSSTPIKTKGGKK